MPRERARPGSGYRPVPAWLTAAVATSSTMVTSA
jgi:hypothetical protein